MSEARERFEIYKSRQDVQDLIEALKTTKLSDVLETRRRHPSSWSRVRRVCLHPAFAYTLVLLLLSVPTLRSLMDTPNPEEALLKELGAPTLGASREEVLPTLQRILDIQKQQLGPQHPQTTATLTHLAMLYREQGDHKQAEARFQEALTILKTRLGPQHLQIAATLTHLAMLYREQGDHKQAEALLQEALIILKQIAQSPKEQKSR